jgi:hypothetical protein
VYVDRFNKTVALVTEDGKQLILDATQKYCPATITPYPLLNTQALLVDKKTNKLTAITSTDEAYKSSIKINSSVDKDGLLTGSCIISSADYAKESGIKKIKESKNSFVVSEYEKSDQGLKVDSFFYDYPADDKAPLVQRFNFRNQIDETGGFILLNYNLFTGLVKNPFTSDVRFTNINFGYPYQVEVEESIELPPNSKTDDLIKNKSLETGNKDIFLSREVKRTGNTITIKIIFKQTTTLVEADSYPELKAFYKSMIDMLNEPVVIKLGK